MIIDFSNLDIRDYPILVLKTLNGNVIQPLGYAFNLKANFCYNEVSEITFDIASRAVSIPGILKS